MSKWINASKRLPPDEPANFYLVHIAESNSYWEHDYIMCLYYMGEWHLPYKTLTVTHWMPIDPLPEVKVSHVEKPNQVPSIDFAEPYDLFEDENDAI